MTTETICMCGGILDFEDDLYVCVNPDCEVVTLPSTIVKEKDGIKLLAQDMQDYKEASRKLTTYWKKHHKEYEAYDY